MAKRKRRAKSAAPRRRKRKRTVHHAHRAPVRRNPARRKRRRSTKAVLAQWNRAPRRRSAKRKRHSHWGKVKGHTRRVNPSQALIHAGTAAAIGLAAFCAVPVANYFVTKDLAKDGELNRMLLGAAVALGGAFLAHKGRPTYGAALAAGGVVAGFGRWALNKVMEQMPGKDESAGWGQKHPGQYNNRYLAGAYQRHTMGAVMSPNGMGALRLGAVMNRNSINMGAPGGMHARAAVGGPPWMQGNPYG